MSFEPKVYVVSGTMGVIAIRLTFEAARAIAKLDGGRRIERFVATKSHQPDPAEPGGAAGHGYQRFGAD